MKDDVIIVSGGGAVRLSEIALVHWSDKERTRCKIWLRGNPTDFTLTPRVDDGAGRVDGSSLDVLRREFP